MKLRLDGEPEELKTKGPELVKALSALVREHNPELSDMLEKALPKSAPRLRYPAVKHLQVESEKAYKHYTTKMIDAIAKVLEAEKDDNLPHDHTKPTTKKSKS